VGVVPSSFVDSVPGVMHLVIESLGQIPTPNIVDIGPGWGKYGLMVREYLAPARLDAVEVQQGLYLTQEAIYDDVHVGDARLYGQEFWNDYDLALLIDVIEHMTLDEGHLLLDRLIASGAKVVVSTPKVFEEQHDDHNPFEEHVSVWGWEDFQRHGILDDRSTIDSIIFLLG
jgi:hypothetical protein